MAKPNYSFAKRQRELAKKKQQDEKDARKREAKGLKDPAADPAVSNATDAVDSPNASDLPESRGTT